MCSTLTIIDGTSDGKSIVRTVGRVVVKLRKWVNSKSLREPQWKVQITSAIHSVPVQDVI
jgi:hypothetical protein